MVRRNIGVWHDRSRERREAALQTLERPEHITICDGLQE
jgi:hypothetical protein